MTAPDELIERLEEATGPSRELDAALASLIGYDEFTKKFNARDWHFGKAPNFTSSIDLARALVPVAHSCASGDLNENGQPWACVTADAEPCKDYTGEGSNEAIATCIAAIKARKDQP